MTTSVAITDAVWTSLGTGLTTVILQPSGDIYVHIGTTTPTAVSRGYLIKSGVPATFGDISALGGKVWVRSLDTYGGVTFDAA